MKKILSFWAVAAIVTSTFAFTNKNKALTFCVKGGNGCTLLYDKVENPAGIVVLSYPLAAGKWNGTVAGCVNASPITDCIVSIKVINN